MKVGDKVYVKFDVVEHCPWHVNSDMRELEGSLVTIRSIYGDEVCIEGHIWAWHENCFQKEKPDPSKRPKVTFEKTFEAGAFKLPVARTNRDKEIVKLVQKAIDSKFQAKAIKVEMEGRIGRKGMFRDTHNANDYVLEYLSQFGLAERCEDGENREAHYFKPVLPLVFSRVYTDSETEWTFTLAIDKPEYALLLPKFVDAFNELKRANKCKVIDVRGSGMHMSYMHQTHYPASNQSGFQDFQTSTRHLMPALFFASANLKRGGKVVTRGIGPRAPFVSGYKFNAIHYDDGALEFRVFDTCYTNRQQILDNLAFMSVMVSKYWGRKVKPITTSGYKFGIDSTELDINEWFDGKDVLTVLNVGLKRIKPTYLKISDMKKARKFNVTMKTAKPNCRGYHKCA